METENNNVYALDGGDTLVLRGIGDENCTHGAILFDNADFSGLYVTIDSYRSGNSSSYQMSSEIPVPIIRQLHEWLGHFLENYKGES